MQETKLIRILSFFDLRELKKLKLLVDSPYFNNEEPVRALMDYLLRYAPEFDHPRINYLDAYRYVFHSNRVPADPRGAISKVAHKLILLVREFIAQEEMQEHSAQKNLHQIQFFYRHGMLDSIPKLLQETDDLLEAHPHRHEYYFRLRLLFEADRSTYLNTVQDRSSLDYNLNRQDRALDAYYALSKLQMYCFAKNAELRTQVEFDYSQKESLLYWMRQSGILEDPNINVWYLALQLLETPDHTRYQALKTAMRQLDGAPSQPSLRILYSYLANTARLIFSDRQAYFRALFDLYREQLEQNILYVNGYLTPIMLRNITIVGLKLREFDWVHRFLQENADRIVPSFLEREDIVTLCRAYLHFEKGEYHDTLALINELRYESLFTKMDERRIRLMCYYELKLFDPLEDLVNSFRKLITINRKSIPEQYIKDNRLFINFLNKLAATRSDPKNKRQALAEEICQVPIMPEKEWLLAKAAE